jgi:class 3 adenylate cyclase/tetratricopeptide (TPR) repeat protein
MQCPRCRAESREGRRFCTRCGSSLEASCPHCGFSNEPGDAFCGGCGRSLPAAGSPSETRFASPQTYTPSHLAEQIITSRAALEGERKQVTVLFADLKASLELLAGRDPEEARAQLDPVLERMMEAVHRYEGTVNQVMGDGIMALFGAPLAHEDHAVRACYAALRMQESLARYSEQVGEAGDDPVQIRVGLNSGEVVVRSIGSDLHMDYTAVGQTVHLAARMEELAPPGRVWLTASTLRLGEGRVQVTTVGLVPVRGLAEPVEVFELVGTGSRRSRLGVTAADALTPFVGRQAELDTLHQARERAGAGHGQLVGLMGEPGMGKTRLLYEFTRLPQSQRWLLLETSGVSYGVTIPCLPIADLLKAYFQIEDRDDARKIREKIAGKLVTLDETLLGALPPFLALLDVPADDRDWEALDPPRRRLRTFDVLKRLLLRESQVQPVCLVVENLHWLDSETQAFLDDLVESLPTARILLVVNYRPDYQHGWGRKTYYTQLRLDPLPREGAGRLLDSLLGPDAGLRPLKDLLIEKTEANPFFMEESVWSLVETRVLSGQRGAYRLAKPVHSIQVPPTVHALMAARIDRLPAGEKRVLQAASVIGKDVPLRLLQAIAGLPEEVLRRDLARLRAGEFLYEVSLFPDFVYTFKHALTYEVAYRGLLQDRRRALHARIVEAIEQLYPDRLAEHVEQLAHHALRAELWSHALAYFRQAGGKAAARYAHRQAVACFEHALEALGRLPESRATAEQAVDVRLALRNSLIPLGEHARIAESLREAERIARALADQHRIGQVAAHLSAHFLWTGDNDRALESGQRALALTEALGTSALRVQATFRLGQVHFSRGDHRRAVEYLGRNVAELTGDLLYQPFGLPYHPSVSSRAWAAWCLAELGEFAEGLARGAEAVQLAEAVDHAYSRVIASVGAGVAHLIKGESEEAIAVLEPGLRLCEGGSFPLWFPEIARALGGAFVLTGRLADGLPLLDEAVRQAAAMQLLFGHSRRIADLGDAHRLAGELQEATTLAREALRLAQDHGERGSEAWALRLLGEIASHRDPLLVEEAEGQYRRALTLAGELGMRPLAAHCHLGLGRMYRRAGDRPEWREHLGAAAAQYHELGMSRWASEARAAGES